MSKTILARVLGCVLFLSLILHPSNSLVRWGEGNIFDGDFKEPCEMSIAIFWDGHILKFTTYEAWRVNLPYWQFKEFVETKGYKIGDIAIKIHNHLVGASYNFSEGDLGFMREMRDDGFQGSYCLRHPSGDITYIRESNIALTQFLMKKETREFLKKLKVERPEAFQELVAFIKEQFNDN